MWCQDTLASRPLVLLLCHRCLDRGYSPISTQLFGIQRSSLAHFSTILALDLVGHATMLLVAASWVLWNVASIHLLMHLAWKPSKSKITMASLSHQPFTRFCPSHLSMQMKTTRKRAVRDCLSPCSPRRFPHDMVHHFEKHTRHQQTHTLDDSIVPLQSRLWTPVSRSLNENHTSHLSNTKTVSIGITTHKRYL